MSWHHAHEKLVEIAVKRGGLEQEEARWIAALHRERAHLFLGYATFAEYVERTCGYSTRQAHERIRVALALESLPALGRALAGGTLCWSAVRELCRVATGETEDDWIEAAKGKTVRQLETLVSCAEIGDRPDASRPEAPKRHVLRIEVGAETYATYREAISYLQRQAGGGLGEEEALLLMARSALGGPKDEGTASYQIAMSVCPECKRAKQQGRGKVVSVENTVREMAECDAQRLSLEPDSLDNLDTQTHVGQRAEHEIPPATRRFVKRRDGVCQVPGCGLETFLDLHHIIPRAKGGSHDANNLICACAAHHAALHRGTLSIEGSLRAGLRFFHADGSAYGARPQLDRALADAQAALESFGFKRSEVKAALARVDAGADVPQMVKTAMKILYPANANRVCEPRVAYLSRAA